MFITWKLFLSKTYISVIKVHLGIQVYGYIVTEDKIGLTGKKVAITKIKGLALNIGFLKTTML